MLIHICISIYPSSRNVDHYLNNLQAKMGAATLRNIITDERLKMSKDIKTFKKRLKTYLFKGYI